MERIALTARLLLPLALVWTMVDLTQDLGARLAVITAPTAESQPRPIIQMRRSMMERLSSARVRGASDPLTGERQLIDVFSAARDPQIRDRAAFFLLELAVNDWPSGYRRDFLTEIVPGALESARTHQLPVSVILAQAILESGWGRSQLAEKHHNLFGVKAGSLQASTTLPTLEASNTGVRIQYAAFRTFDSPLESIAQHGNLIATDHRYASARDHTGNWRQFVAELAPVYASDPAYAGHLTQIITQYDLDRWDGLVQGRAAGEHA